LRAIEETFSVVAPDLCGHGEFVDEKFKPICPTAHVLHYNGENLEKLFKRKTENIIRKLAFMLGVLPDALSEFIVAWDLQLEEGVEKKLAFDRALTAAEKVEQAEEDKQKRFAELRIKANHPPYENFLNKATFPDTVNRHLHSVVLELDEKTGWTFKEVFTNTP
jgi:hypothetical protein